MREPLPIDDYLVLPADLMRYEFSRSGGPGGQHVNTTDTRVRLRFDLERCDELSEDVKARIRGARPADITEDGELLIVCQEHRSQIANVEGARHRLAELVRRCLVTPKKRTKTKATRASHTRRLTAKSKRGDVKAGRGRVRED